MDDLVRQYIDTVVPAKRRRDAETLHDLLHRITGETGHLSGTIVGFGHYHYRYASGREGDAAAAGFAPRKAAMSIYLSDGIGSHVDLLEQLGPHRTGVGCLYITDLESIDLSVLESIIRRSYTALTTGTYAQRAREGEVKR